jgi:hypothetical protein
MSDPTVVAELAARLRETPLRTKELAALLDGLGHEERIAWVRSVGRAEQRRLYEAAAGFLPLGLADLVPPTRAAGETVRHFGKNTLPAFTHFEKRFCRPEGEDPQRPARLFGFNFQSMSWLTGPGYYVAYADPDRPEVLIDYREVPPAAPAGWPPVRRNETGGARFVYGFMVDRLRRVSEHVTIGSAIRNGRELGSWFLLTREG